MALGYKPVNLLAAASKNVCDQVYCIGGAEKTSNAFVAIQDDYQIGLKL